MELQAGNRRRKWVWRTCQPNETQTYTNPLRKRQLYKKRRERREVLEKLGKTPKPRIKKKRTVVIKNGEPSSEGLGSNGSAGGVGPGKQGSWVPILNLFKVKGRLRV